MTAEVVQLPVVNLNDIPQRLRQLAEDIETGIRPGITSVILIIPQLGDFPKVYGWGDIEGTNDPIIQLSLAKHWFLDNLVLRN